MPKDSEFNNDNKFDIDLKVGQSYEKSLAEILRFGKVEVKTEIDTWRHTGNIAIEIRCRGKKSGISVTEAQTWIHLLSYKNKIEGGFIFQTKYLKDKIVEMHKNKTIKIVMGGDDNMSQMVLIPIKDLFV